MDKIAAFFLDPANWSGSSGIPARLGEHLVISGSSVLLALLVAIPIGLYVGHTNRGSGLAINLANIGRAIPSYAMMVIPVPLTLTLAPILGYDAGFGLTFLPIFIAMTFLAVPPILVSTYAGLRSVDRDLIEAGRGMGLSERQILTRIGDCDGDDRGDPRRRRPRTVHLRRPHQRRSRLSVDLRRGDSRRRPGDRRRPHPCLGSGPAHAAGPSEGKAAAAIESDIRRRRTGDCDSGIERRHLGAWSDAERVRW
jgi:hypothetical protein